MEKETLFTTSKWEIMKALAKEPCAPLGIAKTLNTTIANVSQQLRLLEAASLVQKKRLANVQAGKPRALYSLKENMCFLSVAATGKADKKILTISPVQIAVSRCWLLNTESSNILAKFCYINEQLFMEIGELYFHSKKKNEILLTNDTIDKEFEVSFENEIYTIRLQKNTTENKTVDNEKLIYKKDY